jgi:hypothetical protein
VAAAAGRGRPQVMTAFSRAPRCNPLRSQGCVHIRHTSPGFTQNRTQGCHASTRRGTQRRLEPRGASIVHLGVFYRNSLRSPGGCGARRCDRANVLRFGRAQGRSTPGPIVDSTFQTRQGCSARRVGGSHPSGRARCRVPCMEHGSGRYWTEWLPSSLAAEAVAEEPKRFSAAVRGISAAIAGARGRKDQPGAWHSVLPWIDVTSRCVQRPCPPPFGSRPAPGTAGDVHAWVRGTGQDPVHGEARR